MARKRRNPFKRHAAVRKAGMGRSLSWPMRVAAIGVGAAIAGLPQLARPIAGTPVTIAALVGAAVLLRFGRSDLTRFLAVGLVLGGGVGQAIQAQLGPAIRGATASLAPAPAAPARG